MRSGRPPSCPSFPRRRVGFAFFLALALVTVQMLGLAHGIVHADRGEPLGEPASRWASHGTTGDSHDAAASGHSPLFAGHDQGPDCDAFDAASHADLAVDARIDTAALPRAATACCRHAAWRLAAQAQGFLARAPPVAA